jgi:hypothetical protein
MYLAPLNYNRFFERVFRETSIAKRFLEDFLNVKITFIEALPRKHQMTDDAALVEFDYRCKINDQFYIIDMQQWYKRDVVKRFYMYFCNNTSLQLEHLKPVTVPMPNGKTYKTKSYDQIEPSITLVWMVDDSLGFTEDVIAYSIFPEVANTFLHDDNLWNSQDKAGLLKHREAVLKVMDNTHKNLDFLSTNRLVYMFQPNIIRNQKVNKSFPWFEFAAKTKNPKNVAADFKKYIKDPIFVEVMEKLKTSVFNDDDFEYVTDFEAYEVGVQNYNDSIRREAIRDVQWAVRRAEQGKQRAEQEKQRAEQEKQRAEQEKQRAEQGKQRAEQEKQRAEQEKQRAEQEKQHLLEKQLHMIAKFLKRGDSAETIADFMEIDIVTLQSYIKQLNIR